MKTIALIGCGGLGRIIAQGLLDPRLSEHYQLIGVCDINASAAQELGSTCGCAAYTSPDDLLRERPSYVVEAAGVSVLKKYACPVLRAGSDLLVLSIGAFADTTFYESVRECAREHGRKVHLLSGAIGGFDLIRSAMWSGQLSAAIQNIKPPESLTGAPFLQGRVLSKQDSELLFDGSAAEAIQAFPKNVNVAVALAVASVGVDQTRVQVISDPQKELNVHRVLLNGDFGYAELEIASKPSDTASSSALAAYSALAKLESLCSEISF